MCTFTFTFNLNQNCLANFDKILRFSDSPWDLEGKLWDRHFLLTAQTMSLDGQTVRVGS